jgi:hypothetical protein
LRVRRRNKGPGKVTRQCGFPAGIHPSSLYDGDMDRPKLGRLAILLRRVRLSDDLGWHHIPFPPTRFDQGRPLTIRFTKFAGAPSLDVAVSGLELLKNGKAIDLHVPEIVDFTTGADCG